MSSQATLITIITDSPLSQTTKNFFVKKVQKEGATEENILALKELLRAVGHQAANDIGIQADANDPTIQAAQAQMHKELNTASATYTDTMQRLEAEAKRLASDIQDDLKQLEKIVVESAKAEA